MKITFVKKILKDGSPCAKCADVSDLLEKNKQMDSINETLIADERDPQSAGMILATKYKVERAPFFVVEQDNGQVDIYTVYYKFAKEVLAQTGNEKDENQELLRNNSDLDFL